MTASERAEVVLALTERMRFLLEVMASMGQGADPSWYKRRYDACYDALIRAIAWPVEEDRTDG